MATSYTGQVSKLKEILSYYDPSKSQTEILGNIEKFSCLNPGATYLDDTDLPYSSYNYSECEPDEKERFKKEVLRSLTFLVTNSISAKTGEIWEWGSVLALQHRSDYAGVQKDKRMVLWGVSTDTRPVGDAGWTTWNGLQVIDLDIKDAEIASELHRRMPEFLQSKPWFLGLAYSSSHKGLHIYTKIKPITFSIDKRKIEFRCNFRHKYSFIFVILQKLSKELGYTDDDIIRWLDFATAKPQQGLFIAHDPESFVSTGFKNQRLDVNFETSFDNGIESINVITHPTIAPMFAKLEWFSEETSGGIKKEDIAEVGERDITKNTTVKYKFQQRWQLANTLVSVFGADAALKYLIELCPDTPVKELRGYVGTAVSNNKEMSLWAVNELNKKHGFNIKVKDEVLKTDTDAAVASGLTHTTPETIDDTKTITFRMKSDQWLSDIGPDIMSNLGPITLIEAGAGYGKTEMVKSFKSKTLLILPFVSTIKSKVEKSETTSDWLYFYGRKSPSMDDLMGPRSITMTIDKFSRLNIMELAMCGFKYIVLDESHLLFMSQYRSCMSPTVQRLANIPSQCGCKVILMTGTPTGEEVFFSNIRHIRVVKDDTRIKDVEIHFCPTDSERMIYMARSIADDIISGKKILYPTNRGNTYYDMMSGLVQKELNDRNWTRQLNRFYYKKSNYGDESMDDINFGKTVGNNDIIFCTTYLSVGVDICDRGEFSVYFDTPWIPQDIEQFANRLRNNDLFVKIFLPRRDSEGNQIIYNRESSLDLRYTDDDVLMARNIIQMCNDTMNRNTEDSKFNPITAETLRAYPYIQWDENTARYWLDETLFKLHLFEGRYKEYATQLPILIRGMVRFGYTVGTVEHSEVMSDDATSALSDYIKGCKKTRYVQFTRDTFALLDHITDDNIDTYKEIAKGNYDIIRSTDEKYTNMRDEQGIYTDDIEVLEKNLPTIFSLYKYYDIPVIKDIYRFCLDTHQDKINWARLGRIREFVRLVSNIKKERLDLPVFKMVSDMKSWAVSNPETTKADITKFIEHWAVVYANTVPRATVDDTNFLFLIRDLVASLWKVVIVESTPKNKIIKIHPFELIWEMRDTTKPSLTSDIAEFFVGIVDEIDEKPTTPDLPSIPTGVDIPELVMTPKCRKADIVDELKSMVHSQYDYATFTADGANDRFIDKQRRTNMFHGAATEPESGTESPKEPELWDNFS